MGLPVGASATCLYDLPGAAPHPSNQRRFHLTLWWHVHSHMCATLALLTPSILPPLLPSPHLASTFSFGQTSLGGDCFCPLNNQLPKTQDCSFHSLRYLSGVSIAFRDTRYMSCTTCVCQGHSCGSIILVVVFTFTLKRTAILFC